MATGDCWWAEGSVCAEQNELVSEQQSAFFIEEV